MTSPTKPYKVKEVWLMRFNGHRWPLHQCMVMEILGNCIRATSVQNVVGIDGYYEVGKDIDLVQKIEDEES